MAYYNIQSRPHGVWKRAKQYWWLWQFIWYRVKSVFYLYLISEFINVLKLFLYLNYFIYILYLKVLYRFIFISFWNRTVTEFRIRCKHYTIVEPNTLFQKKFWKLCSPIGKTAIFLCLWRVACSCRAA